MPAIIACEEPKDKRHQQYTSARARTRKCCVAVFSIMRILAVSVLPSKLSVDECIKGTISAEQKIASFSSLSVASLLEQKVADVEAAEEEAETADRALRGDEAVLNVRQVARTVA